MKTREVLNAELEIVAYDIKCLGCGHNHTVYTKPGFYKACWTFNGDMEKPTFYPSLLCTTGSFAQPGFKDDPALPPTRCHSFIIDGKIQYLNDCTHDLKGQTVELPNFD